MGKNTKKRYEGRGAAGAMLLLLLAVPGFGIGIAAQEQPVLVSKLKAASVPVKGAALKDGTLVVRLEYADSTPRDPETIRIQVLRVFREAATAAPSGAVKIAVEFGGSGETYATWAASRRDSAAFAAGRLDEARFLAAMEKDSSVSLKELMASAMPDEAAIRKQMERIEAENRSGAAGATPPAKRAAGSRQTGQAAGTKAAPNAKPTHPPAPVPGGRDEAGSGFMAGDTPIALFTKGEALLKQRDYWGAAPYFQRTLGAYPAESNRYLGICYYFAGLLEAALQHLEESYRREPGSRMTVLYLATCNDKLGRRAEALRRYEEYLELDPDDADNAAFARRRILSLRGK